jgi:hypothetical protein
MAASVRIDNDAFVDPRVELLGDLAGYNRYEALGRLAHLWRVCTDRQQHVVSEAIVRSCLGAAGVDALLQSELGERHPDGIRVRGTQGRIEWLEAKRTAARAGGAAKAARAKTLAVGSQNPATSSHDPSIRQADGRHLPAYTLPTPCPPSPSPSLREEKKETAPAALSLEIQESGDQKPASKPATAKAAAGPPSDHQRVIAAFWAAFERASGVKPTYTADVGAQVKRLLVSHSADEVCRRVENFFGRPREQWPADRDWGTFVKHFDKWAVGVARAPTAGPRPINPDRPWSKAL